MEDYFIFFDMPRKFQLDPTELRKKYLQKSREVHPDYFVGSDPDTLKRIEEQSALTHQAYRHLWDERLRALHIIALEGIDEKDISLSSDFLMEMMELNECIEDEGISHEVQNIILKGKSLLTTELKKVMQAYDAGEAKEKIQESLRKAAEIILSLRYYDRLDTAYE